MPSALPTAKTHCTHGGSIIQNKKNGWYHSSAYHTRLLGRVLSGDITLFGGPSPGYPSVGFHLLPRLGV